MTRTFHKSKKSRGSSELESIPFKVALLSSCINFPRYPYSDYPLPLLKILPPLERFPYILFLCFQISNQEGNELASYSQLALRLSLILRGQSRFPFRMTWCCKLNRAFGHSGEDACMTCSTASSASQRALIRSRFPCGLSLSSHIFPPHLFLTLPPFMNYFPVTLSLPLNLQGNLRGSSTLFQYPFRALELSEVPQLNGKQEI